LKPSEEPRGVRDLVVRIGRDNETTELLVHHAHVGQLMYPGIQVVAEITLALEAPFAIGAVGVHVAIVAPELRVNTEYLYDA